MSNLAILGAVFINEGQYRLHSFKTIAKSFAKLSGSANIDQAQSTETALSRKDHEMSTWSKGRRDQVLRSKRKHALKIKRSKIGTRTYNIRDGEKTMH